MSNARNGGNSTRVRSEQRRRSYERLGLSMWAHFGHHSWHKSHSKRNPTGAITHAPKEWGSNGRKEEEHATALAKMAETDAIEEGLVEVNTIDSPYSGRWDPIEMENEEVLDKVWDLYIPGVSLNGQELVPQEDDYYDYEYDEPFDYGDDYMREEVLR